MSDFGDFDDDDAVDTAPADPEQVARKLHALRRRDGFEIEDWFALDPGDRLALIAIIAALLGWLKRQGSHP